MKPLLACFCLLFCLTGSFIVAGAQEEQNDQAPVINDQAPAINEEAPAINEEAPAINDTRADSPRAEGSSADNASVGANEAAPDRDEADADADAEEEGLPRDPGEPFVPSVQISEDLSVSFPVDI